MKKNLLFLLQLCLSLAVFSQVQQPYYKNASPSRASANIGSGVPFGANSSAGARMQCFYPPAFWGSGVPSGGVTMNRLYFFADSTYADTIFYGNLNIVLGEFATAPTVGFTWNTAASRQTTVVSGSGISIKAVDSNWFYIDLNTPYVYDPSKYLLVDFTIGSQSPFVNTWFIKAGPTSGSYISATNATAGTPNTLSGGSLPAIGFDPLMGFNNAGIERVIVPPVCASSQDLFVKVKNSGKNVINSVTVNWKLNGTLQTPVYLSAPIDTFGSAKNDTVLNLGSVSFSAGPVDVQVYVSNPNSASDPDHANDTISFKMGSSLNGTYLVSPNTGGFNSIASAIQALSDYGVCGPVTFMLDTVTFFEQPTFMGRYNGASPTNPIVFQGMDQKKSMIAYGPAVVNAKHIIKLQGAAYITFRNLTVKTLSSTYGWGFHLIDTCRAIGIKNCIIDNSVAGANVAANNTAGISISGLPTGLCIPGPCATSLSTAARADSLEIDSNLILYGYQGINITGNATTLMGRYNKIRNNTILYAYQNSVNLVSQDNFLVNNNVIFPRQTGAVSVGVFLNAVGSTTVNGRSSVSGNKISGYATAGISLNASVPADSIQKGLITNNMIGGMEQLVDATPIYITGCKNWTISNNSLNRDISNTTANTAAGIRVLGTTGNISILNNIISISKPGLAIPIHLLLASNVDSMNRNVFYRADTVTNNQLINIAGTAYPYATFRGAAGFNTNSAFVKPQFRNDTALYLSSICFLPNAMPLGYVGKDIDGNSRSTVLPVVGAHEKIVPLNNLAVLALKQPTSPISPGTYALRVLVQNLGSNPISSFTLSYSKNGATPVSQVFTPGTSLGACDTISVLLSGFGITALDSMVQLNIYSSQPNATTDGDLSNDTLKLKLYTPLGGNYFIGGPNASFANFSEAAAALMASGVKSSVTFQVYPGIYNEQVSIVGPIAGMSASKRVVFEGFDSTDRVLTFAGNGGLPYTLKIDNAPYISFRNLKIQSSGASYGWVVQITGGSNACAIKRCAITITGAGTTNTTSNFMGITVSGATITTVARADSLEIDSNTINFGYQGINIYSGSAAVSQNIKIRNNTILNTQQYAVYLVYQQTPEISNNTIVCRGSSSGVGIYCQNVTTPATGTLFTQINGNRISNYATAGIYLTACTNASASLKGRMINNAIGGLEKLAAGNSLYATGSTNWLICNNSINHDFATTTATTAAAIRLVGAASATFGITLINNVIAVTGNGTGLPLYTQVIGNVDAMDYNLFYRADTTNSFMAYLGSNISTAALKGTGNFNKNSTIYKPGFTAANNLNPNPADSSSWSMNGRGTYLSYASKDINQVQRPINNWSGVADIGAFEFTPTAVPPLARAIPDTNYAYSTQVFVFGVDTVAKINWGSSAPGFIAVRQYSGVVPVSYDPTKNYMYFYTSFSTMPVAAVDVYYRDNWIGTHSSETGIWMEQLDQGMGSYNIFTAASTIDTVRNMLSVSSLATTASQTFISGTNNNSTITPVVLSDFKAAKMDNKVFLNWTTALEKNSSYFSIERAVNGGPFEAIASVKAKGNSNVLSSYAYHDLLFGVNVNDLNVLHYRLKMIDRDATFTYSKTLAIEWNQAHDETGVMIYPNPFQNSIQLLNPYGANSKVRISDLSGKILLEQDCLFINDRYTLDNSSIGALMQGVYLLQLEVNGNWQSFKLFKE